MDLVHEKQLGREAVTVGSRSRAGHPLWEAAQESKNPGQAQGSQGLKSGVLDLVLDQGLRVLSCPGQVPS